MGFPGDFVAGGALAALAAAGVPPAGVATGADPLPTVPPASGYEARTMDDTLDLPRDKADELRRDALARALLWLDPEPSLEDADQRHNPRDMFAGAEQVACKFRPRKVGGSTPKFDCVFAGGEVLKVKYGRSPEIHTEVAATRLLRALGAGADSMYLMKRLRCFGCPEDPERMLRCISSPFDDFVRQCERIYGERTPAGELRVTIDFGRFVDFATVAIERKLEGKEIETEDARGWGFDELDEVQADRGDQARAERDALRLLAVLLNNWDNRADNQRLVCLDEGPRPADGGCRRPFAYMQDVGGTFGHVGAAKAERKLDLAGWRAVPIWKDAATCLVGLESPPLHGATFGETVISEGGRSFLAERLGRLTTSQVRALFEGAGFADYPETSGVARGVDEWVRAFEDRVRQIVAREPCPTP
jgi:hypothetical protein